MSSSIVSANPAATANPPATAATGSLAGGTSGASGVGAGGAGGGIGGGGTGGGSRYAIADRPRLGLRAALARREALLALLLLAVFLTNSILLPNFLDLDNLADGTFNFSEKALIALPMALLIICREIDISVSGILALSSVAMGLAHANGAPPAALLPIAIATGAACGCLNGVMVTRFGLPSIVVTIGTVSLFRGLASVVLGDQAYTGYPQIMADWGQGYFFDAIPREFVVLLAFAALFAVVLHATSWGRRIYAIGNNPVAARFSGISVDRYRLMLFMLTGAMAGLAGYLLTGRIGSTRPNIAMGWELEIITMVILGGVSIAGGAGTIGGVILAVLTLGTVTYGLQMANIPGIYMTIVIGLLLLATIALPRLLRGRRK
jgi:rhamnose transport system permease protein